MYEVKGINNDTLKRKMMYILSSEDRMVVAAFDGSESDLDNLLDQMAQTGHRIIRVDHVMIWTADNNPFMNVDVLNR